MLLQEISGALASPVDAFNLMASAEKPGGTDWLNGITWRSEICPAYDGVAWCNIPDNSVPEGADRLEQAMPVAFRVAFECTTLSGVREGIAERRAQAITSHVVARELWTGELTRADRFLSSPATSDALRSNAYLMDGTASAVVPSAVTVLGQIAELEEQARAALGGQKVLLHVPIRIGSALPDLHRVGNELRTNSNSVVVSDSGYTGQGPYQGGTDEVQDVDITGAPTGGTFTLTYDGETTGPLPFNANPGQVQVFLTGLPNLNAGDVTVSGSAGNWTVTFDSRLGNVPQMTADGSGLTGGAAPAVNVVTTTPGAADTPAAGTWVYATGPVTVRLTPVDVFDHWEAETVDRPTNRRREIAQRAFMVTYDTCAAFAMQLNESP